MRRYATVDPLAEFERIKPTVAASVGSDVAGAKHVPGSVANLDYRVDLADGRHVFVKVGPRAELAAEAWALGRVAALGMSVPAVLAYEDAPEVTPTPFVVLESLASNSQRPPGVMRAVGRAMKRIHSIEVRGYGPIQIEGHPMSPDAVAGEYASWQAFVASILQDVDELAQARLLSAHQRAQIHRMTSNTAGASPLARDSGVLLHADIKPQHIMAVDGALTGIIDWGDVTAGDPAWDLARASMMDPTEFGDLARAYDAQLDEVSRLLRPYRVLWNARALAYEYHAGGDWFAEFQRRIAADLCSP